jgi:uncharacterized membrane protein
MVMAIFASRPAIDDARVVAAIASAEQRTSGEIRVFVSSRATDDAVKSAGQQFERMAMTRTAQRNGVLIFLAPTSHAFAVIGDQGVHEKCGDAFWRELAAAMSEHFKRGDFTDGLILGITRAGDLLARHFPRTPDDRNELPDAIQKDH